MLNGTTPFANLDTKEPDIKSSTGTAWNSNK
jgi:hypothetical protein